LTLNRHLQSIAAFAPANIIKAVMDQEQASAGTGPGVVRQAGPTARPWHSAPLVLNLKDPPLLTIDAADA
jgi:hypothetical protein